MKDKAIFNLGLPTLKMFLLCVMNAINSCWDGALEKPSVYTELLLWLQNYSGCLVLTAVGGTTSDHPGQQDSQWRAEKLSARRTCPSPGRRWNVLRNAVVSPGVRYIGRGRLFEYSGLPRPLSCCQSLQPGTLLTYNFTKTVISRVLRHFPFGKPRVKFQALLSLIVCSDQHSLGCQS